MDEQLTQIATLLRIVMDEVKTHNWAVTEHTSSKIEKVIGIIDDTLAKGPSDSEFRKLMEWRFLLEEL